MASVPTRVATGNKALMDIGDGGFEESCDLSALVSKSIVT